MSNIAVLHDYVRTWEPIAKQLLSSTNERVVKYGLAVQQEVDRKRQQLDAELKEAEAFMRLNNLFPKPAEPTPPVEEEEKLEPSEPKQIEAVSTVQTSSEIHTTTECTIDIE